MKHLPHLILTLLILLSNSPIASSQRTVGSIDVPPGFSRVEAGGFGAYLRALPLKPAGSVVRLYDGQPKAWQRGAYDNSSPFRVRHVPEVIHGHTTAHFRKNVRHSI